MVENEVVMVSKKGLHSMLVTGIANYLKDNGHGIDIPKILKNINRLEQGIELIEDSDFFMTTQIKFDSDLTEIKMRNWMDSRLDLIGLDLMVLLGVTLDAFFDTVLVLSKDKSKNLSQLFCSFVLAEHDGLLDAVNDFHMNEKEIEELKVNIMSKIN